MSDRKPILEIKVVYRTMTLTTGPIVSGGRHESCGTALGLDFRTSQLDSGSLLCYNIY